MPNLDFIGNSAFEGNSSFFVVSVHDCAVVVIPRHQSKRAVGVKISQSELIFSAFIWRKCIYIPLICECNRVTDDVVVRNDFAFFESEGFLAEGMPNYRLIDSGHLEETLSAPVRVHFYYTSSCNLNCAHCFTKNAAVATEMSFGEKVNMLDQMYELGVNEILIGGGEPFTKSDFPDFVEACLSRDIITKVFTNGLLLSDKKLVERMANWNLKYRWRCGPDD